MNFSLVDPFVLAQDCPEALTGKIRSGHSTCIRYNRKGDLLASGRLDGTVIIFDVETNGVARKLRGHTRQVQSLSWSTDGRYLLSASQDWKCVLWDLQDGSRLRTVKFEAPVFIAELHPKSHLICVAALFEDQPVLVDMSGPIPIKKPLPTVPKRSQHEWDTAPEKQAAQNAKLTTTVTIFAPSGEHIITGTNRGWVNIISTSNQTTLYSLRLTKKMVVFMRMAASGSHRDLVVNATDAIIRTLHLPDLDSPDLDVESMRVEVEHEFQERVNRLSWNNVAFSSTGEYVMASTYMNHDIYVWERGHGSLVKILEGPREELSVVDWHPHRPVVAACGMDSGRVYFWSVLTPQRWSALAPDFAEVEENVEYVEKEEEFDIRPIEEINKRRLDLEDEEVDVLTTEATNTDSHSKDEFRMPVLLDIENSDSEDEVIAIGAGQYRRKSPGQGREWDRDGDSGASGDEAAAPRRRTETPRSQNGSKRRRGD